VPTQATGGLSISKSANRATITTAGDTIGYTFRIMNTGALTAHDVAVADTPASPASLNQLSVITCPRTELAPGAATDCTATYAVTAADVRHGGVTNSAVATGSDPDGTQLRSDASRITVPVAGLLLTKHGTVTDTNGDGRHDTGDSLVWSFTLTNTSAIALNSLAVTDRTGGPVTCRATRLEPGQRTTCATERVHRITAAEAAAGVVHNSAEASGLPECATTVAASDFVAPSAICPPVGSNTATASVTVTDPPYGGGGSGGSGGSGGHGGSPIAFTGVAYLGPEVFGGVALIVVGLFLALAFRRRKQ
jgi:uncharacterized repeat protein (TIGR01451 family)